MTALEKLFEELDERLLSHYNGKLQDFVKTELQATLSDLNLKVISVNQDMLSSHLMDVEDAIGSWTNDNHIDIPQVLHHLKQKGWVISPPETF